jgi:hypothetical protein
MQHNQSSMHFPYAPFYLLIKQRGCSSYAINSTDQWSNLNEFDLSHVGNKLGAILAGRIGEICVESRNITFKRPIFQTGAR